MTSMTTAILPSAKREVSEETRRRMSEARRKSPIVQELYERYRREYRGRRPSPAAFAGLAATAALKRLGLTREDSPSLFDMYTAHYLRKFGGSP